MTGLKFKLFVALIIIATGCYVAFLEVRASEDSDEQISESSVWTPSDQQLASVGAACRSKANQNFGECFLAQMPELGASDDAVSFARDYSDQNHGTLAFLRGFHALDSVDVAYAYFPAGGEMRQGWLLVNGSPAVINVDDLDRLPEAQMQKNAEWAALHARYPRLQISLDDSERQMEALPKIERLSDGSERFIVQYALRDGCPSCALAGHATFSFDFDPAGRLVLVRFVGVTPAQQNAG